MIGIPFKDAHLAFISCGSPQTRFIEYWLKEIISRVSKYKFYNMMKWLFKKNYKQCKNWDYFGNAIISPLIQKLTITEIKVIDRDKIGCFPEYLSEKNKDNIDKAILYKNFYFTEHDNIDLNKIITSSKGIIMLHNSWTPIEYKNMSKTEFLKQNVLLSKLLRELLCL